MRIRKVTLRNFKGVSGEFELGKLTAFVGQPRSGKSAIREAIQLVMTGSHEVGATLDAWSQLLEDGSDEAIARLEFGKTGGASVSIVRGKKPSFAGHVGLKCVLPPFSEIVNLSTNAARQRLLARFGEAEWVRPVALSAEQQLIWDHNLKGSGDLAARLGTAEKTFRDSKMHFGRQIGQLKREIDSLRNAAESTGVEELPALKKRLESAIALKAKTEETNRVRADLEKASFRLEKLREKYRDLKESPPSLCPTCKQKVRGALHLDDLKLQIRQEKAEVERLGNLFSVAQGGFSTAEMIPELREKIAQIEAASSAERVIESKSIQLRGLEASQRDVAALEKEAKRLGVKLLEDTKSRAEAAVREFSLPDWRAQLRIDDANVRWELIGSDGRGHPVGTLSGAERCMLALSLGLAWAEEPPIVLLDDADFLGLDQKLAREFLEMLAWKVQEKQIAQVIVARNRVEDIPGTYTLIDMDAR